MLGSAGVALRGAAVTSSAAVPLPRRVHHNDMRCILGARHAAYDQVIEGGDGVGFRPQANLAGAITRVPMIQKERTIQIGLDVITGCDDPDRMPLAERGWLYVRCRQFVAPTVV